MKTKILFLELALLIMVLVEIFCNDNIYWWSIFVYALPCIFYYNFCRSICYSKPDYIHYNYETRRISNDDRTKWWMHYLAWWALKQFTEVGLILFLFPIIKHLSQNQIKSIVFGSLPVIIFLSLITLVLGTIPLIYHIKNANKAEDGNFNLSETPPPFQTTPPPFNSTNPQGTDRTLDKVDTYFLLPKKSFIYKEFDTKRYGHLIFSHREMIVRLVVVIVITGILLYKYFLLFNSLHIIGIP